MKPISQEQILSLRNAKQHFADCYLVSSIQALTNTENGRKILQHNITTDGTNFNIRFNHVIDKAEDYFVSEKAHKNLVLVDRFANEIELDEPHHPIIKAVEVAMEHLLWQHPEKKPLVCRLVTDTIQEFEYNKPSNFMEMFTGRKPIVLNEGGLRQTLKSHREEAMQLFERMDKGNDYSFIAGTGIFGREGLRYAHCYPINGVNFENKYLEITENRSHETIKLPFERAIRGLKYLTGYFNSGLK